jgi:ribosome biogenesis GTPase / thiamine phosphate phosphatase
VTHHPPQGSVLGRVARLDRSSAQVLVDGVATSVRTAGVDVLVGDWVALHLPADDEPRLVEVMPRTAVLSRQSSDRTSNEQALVANVDVVLVTEPAWPGASLGRIERLLVLAWSSGAVPVVVVTKGDLHPDVEALAADVAAAAPGAQVLVVSAVTGAGMDELGSLLGSGRTFALLGPSGAGKSTLVNALAGGPVLETGDVRGDGKGRHTTTHRELVTLPDGSVLVDTPGLRAVGIVGDADAVDDVFGEIAELAVHCRFADCAHEREPGCEVTGAVADGRLPERRLASWRKLQREVAYQRRRGDARAARDEKARWKSISKTMRGHSRP